jgi:hypothetical protein
VVFSCNHHVAVSIATILYIPLRPSSWTHHPVVRLIVMGNQQSTTPYEPKMFSTSNAAVHGGTKPIKSAMRRTSSVSEHASGLSEEGNKTRYLPRGLGAGHSGLVMPTKPGDIAAGAPTGPAGYHSPEWGWYINTTPPTPEMYHSHYSSTRAKKLPSSKDGASSQASVPASASPAFTTTKTAGMGWPSVPL